MKFRLFTAAILLVSGAANANHSSTEFLYQAGKGESYLQGNIDYLISEQTVSYADSKPFDESMTDINLQFAYEMGFYEMLAAYVSLGYGHGKQVFDGEIDINSEVNIIRNVGLNPIDLGLKYRMDLGPGQLYLQGNLSLSFEKLKSDKASSVVTLNRMMGSHSVSTRLAYIMDYSGSMSGGIVFDISLYATAPEGDDIRFKRNPGMAFSLFYEKILADNVFGGAFTYSMNTGWAGLHSKSFYGGLYKISGDRINDSEGLALADFQLYTRILLMAENLYLLGNLNYNLGEEKLMVNEEDEILSEDHDISNLGFGLGLRYTF